jgi:hypothetical protein
MGEGESEGEYGFEGIGRVRCLLDWDWQKRGMMFSKRNWKESFLF